MFLTSKSQTLTCPTERVIGVKRGLRSKSPQPDQMEVQDPPSGPSGAQSQDSIACAK